MAGEDFVKYLFPAYPIMHCGLGNGYVEYPLSKVLGSWGLTIRDIYIDDGGEACVFCYGGIDGKTSMRVQLFIASLSTPEFGFSPHTHFLDLILQYEEDGQGGLFRPKWMRAFWMNFAELYVVDVVEQKSFSLIFNERRINED